jgi:hypothetical protein
VRGGEEEAGVHRGKILATLVEPTDEGSREQTVFGFQVSERFIPQGPELFSSEESHDQAPRSVLETELGHRDWRDLVSGTDSANTPMPIFPRTGEPHGTSHPPWNGSWGSTSSATGADFEIRRFDVGVSH